MLPQSSQGQAETRAACGVQQSQHRFYRMVLMATDHAGAEVSKLCFCLAYSTPAWTPVGLPGPAQHFSSAAAGTCWGPNGMMSAEPSLPICTLCHLKWGSETSMEDKPLVLVVAENMPVN